MPRCYVTGILRFLLNFVRIKNSCRKAECLESTPFRKLQRKSTGETYIYYSTTDFSLTCPSLAIWSRTLTDGSTEVAGETSHTKAEEDILMVTETDESTGPQASASPVPWARGIVHRITPLLPPKKQTKVDSNRQQTRRRSQSKVRI